MNEETNYGISIHTMEQSAMKGMKSIIAST